MSPDGNCFTALVDGGDSVDDHYAQSENRIKCEEYLRQQKVSALDLLVITHLHRDHVRGLASIASDLHIKEAWINVNLPVSLYGAEIEEDNSFSEVSSYMLKSINTFSGILKVLCEKGTKIRQITTGTRSVTVTDSLVFTPLFSANAKYNRQDEIIEALFEGAENREKLLFELDKLSNSISMVIKVECHNAVLLLGADVDAAFWQGAEIPKCNILKLPHHGREDCITPELARTFDPDFVVISSTSDFLSLKALESFLSCDVMPEICCTDTVNMENFCPVHSHKAVRLTIGDNGNISKEFIIF